MYESHSGRLTLGEGGGMGQNYLARVRFSSQNKKVYV